MIEPYGLYVAAAVGAVALYMMMPRRGTNPRKLGALLGAGVLGGLWLWLGRTLFGRENLALPGAAIPYYYIFSTIGLAAAVRVITHTKPVFSALWFVMVVLSTAGMFLVLGAEFVAFGMVIIYGGAILVTYVFVIMLAAQSEEAEEAGEAEEGSPATEYERVAREPALAVLAGFVLLATVLDVAFRPMEPNPAARGLTNEQIVAGIPPQKPAEGQAATDQSKGEPAILTHGTDEQLIASVSDEAQRRQLESVVAPRSIDNVERVGIDLFRGHPLGLELAGVILLVSLVGAVVIARQRGQLETK